MKVFASVLLAVVVLHIGSAAQTNPLPLGSVSNISAVKCTSEFNSSACYQATVSCPKTANIEVMWGITGSGTNGTVVFLNGNGGTIPYGSSFQPRYTQAGLASIEVAWNTQWETAGAPYAANIMNAACRSATLLNYFHSQQTQGAFCSQGFSAGSGALAYALSWYGLGSELDNVELLAGPVFSNITDGCKVPNNTPTVRIVPTDGQPWSDKIAYFTEAPSLTLWTGQQCLPNGRSTDTEEDAWAAQSTVQPGATMSFPNTNLSGWECNNGLNPSAGQGYLFLSQLGTPYSLTAITNCDGAEGVTTGRTPQGVLGQTAVEDDMVNQCVPRHAPK
jgi:hypothetical protein